MLTSMCTRAALGTRTSTCTSCSRTISGHRRFLVSASTLGARPMGARRLASRSFGHARISLITYLRTRAGGTRHRMTANRLRCIVGTRRGLAAWPAWCRIRPPRHRISPRRFMSPGRSPTSTRFKCDDAYLQLPTRVVRSESWQGHGCNCRTDDALQSRRQPEKDQRVSGRRVSSH